MMFKLLLYINILLTSVCNGQTPTIKFNCSEIPTNRLKLPNGCPSQLVLGETTKVIAILSQNSSVFSANAVFNVLEFSSGIQLIAQIFPPSGPGLSFINNRVEFVINTSLISRGKFSQNNSIPLSVKLMFQYTVDNVVNTQMVTGPQFSLLQNSSNLQLNAVTIGSNGDNFQKISWQLAIFCIMLNII